MAQRLRVDGRQVWLKDYDVPQRSRRVITRVWNAIAEGLDAEPLRSPPRHAGEKAKQVELRRITELRECGVLVPEVVGEGRDTLLLSDIGPSLSHRLKTATNLQQVDTLVHDTVAEIVSAHRRGAYFGQAFARNITVSDGRIGFIDFEEDPLEIMPLRDAQARDWMIFAAGISQYYEGRVDVLADMMGQAQPYVAEDVGNEVHLLATRLGFLHRYTRHMGYRARALGVAVLSLRKSFGVLLLALGLILDVVTDGDSDVFNALRNLL